MTWQFVLEHLKAFWMPIIFPFIGDLTGRVLKQQHWNIKIKDGVAWGVFVVCAGIEGYASGLFVGDPNLFFDGATGLITLMVTGPLTKLRPWLQGMDWVELHIFNIQRSLPPAPVLIVPASAVDQAKSSGVAAPTAEAHPEEKEDVTRMTTAVHPVVRPKEEQ